VGDRHREFEAVVRISPASARGNFFLGQAYHQQRNWRRAIPSLLKALEVGHPEREFLLVQLAHAQNESGHPEQALQTLSRAPARASSGRSGNPRSGQTISS